MVKILASDGMQADAIAALKAAGHEVDVQFYEPEELKEAVKKYNVLVVRSATKVREPHIDAALETGELKLVIRGCLLYTSRSIFCCGRLHLILPDTGPLCSRRGWPGVCCCPQLWRLGPTCCFVPVRSWGGEAFCLRVCWRKDLLAEPWWFPV